MAKLEDNFFALSISCLNNYDKILPPTVCFLVGSSIFNKQHVEKRKNVMNVIEATFGTSLSPLFIQLGQLQRIALASD